MPLLLGDVVVCPAVSCDTPSTTVTVWDHEEPLEYVISGGSSVYDYWSVDDDDFVAGNVLGVRGTSDAFSGDSYASYRAHLGDAELRTIYEWCVDNGLTPYISVAVDANSA